MSSFAPRKNALSRSERRQTTELFWDWFLVLKSHLFLGLQQVLKYVLLLDVGIRELSVGSLESQTQHGGKTCVRVVIVVPSQADGDGFGIGIGLSLPTHARFARREAATR